MAQKNLMFQAGMLGQVQLRYTPQQLAVCHFYLIQVEKNGNKQSLLCKSFGETAERVAKMQEGSYLMLIGRTETNKYKSNGKEVYSTELIAEEVYETGATINRAFLAGRFSKDNSYYVATEGKKSLLRNNIATTHNKGAETEHTEFVSVTFFDKVADFVSKYFRKGSEIWVEGKLVLEAYTSKDGSNQVAWKVNAFRADFLGSKKATTVEAQPMPDEAMPVAPAPQQKAQPQVPTGTDGDGFAPIPPGGGWGNLPIN